MLFRLKRFSSVFLILFFLLSGCKGKGEATQDPQAVFTAAAETANAKMTEMAAATPIPTETPTLTATATLSPTATSAPPTATLAPAAVGTVTERVEFVSDVTVPDGTVFAPNQTFTKTWRLRNVGSTTWTTAYSLIFFSGEKMNAPTAVPLPGDVPPNATVDVSVTLVSPATPNQYIGYFMLRNPQGKNFGLGPNADQAFYVWINVAANGTAFPTASPTGGIVPTNTGIPGTPGTSTATVASAAVSNPVMSVDTASFTGSCPHTFVFPIQFTVAQATSVTFKMEAGSGTPGVTLVLPNPRTETVNPGTYSNSFTLDITSSMSS